MKKQIFYGKVENGKLEIYDVTGCNKALSNIQGEVVIEISRKNEQRTPAQNDSIHLYCEHIAEALNNAGLDIKKIIKIDVPWTKELVKELIWRPTQELYLKKKSTTELNKTEDINIIHDIINRSLSEHYKIHIPFPSIDAAIDRERELENK